MTPATPAARIEKTIRAPIARVRAALTDPAQVAKWFSPGPMTATVPTMDARVGGHYEITLHGRGPDNDFSYTMTGAFTELTPTRVAMTMNSTGPDGVPMETTTAFDLQEIPDGTRLVLTQSGFPVQEMADGAGRGWAFAADQLATLCETTKVSP